MDLPIDRPNGSYAKVVTFPFGSVLFVSAPVEVCEQRDPKGLYKKARAGEIREFTGVSAPYEAPENPECIVRTDVQTLGESVAAVLALVRARLAKAG